LKQREPQVKQRGKRRVSGDAVVRGEAHIDALPAGARSPRLRPVAGRLAISRAISLASGVLGPIGIAVVTDHAVVMRNDRVGEVLQRVFLGRNEPLLAHLVVAILHRPEYVVIRAEQDV
jgi:hypothetical protein